MKQIVKVNYATVYGDLHNSVLAFIGTYTQLCYKLDGCEVDQANDRVKPDIHSFCKMARIQALVIKSSLILFDNTSRSVDRVQVFVENMKLNHVESPTNLGICFGINLRFDTHIKSLIQKAHADLQF